MPISAETIASSVVESTTIGADSGGGGGMSNNALCILTDTESTSSYGGEIWNLLSDAATTQNTILNPSGVATGWSIQNTSYAANSSALISFPFYDSGVYLIIRARINGNTSTTFTVSGLNDAALYTFILSGGVDAPGLNGRTINISSSVSGDTATLETSNEDPLEDHIASIPLQQPVGGVIAITVSCLVTNIGFFSTFEIQEFS